MDPFTLNGKKILVTGGSAGIGRSITVHCAMRQAEVHFCARNIQKLKETKDLLPKELPHTDYAVDLQDEDSILALIDKLPSLDGIVLNAGVVKLAPVKYIKSNSIDELLKVNFISSVLLIQGLLKNKKVREGASICFISSIASEFPTVGNALYSATKGAVNSFTRSIALELASKRIRANAILPGFVNTLILSEGSISDEQLAQHQKNYPIGRFGRPEDIAYLALYLLSDASEWMTGSLLTLDGGYSLK